MSGPMFKRNADGVYLTKNGVTIFSTDTLPVALVEPAAIELSNYTIAWPDFTKDNGYYHQTVTGTNPTTGVPYRNETCASYITIPPAEYAADTVLGYAPAGADYLDLKINFKSRSTVPSAILGDNLTQLFKLNVQLCPIGASIVIWEAALFSRMLKFFIRSSDNAIVMRVMQSAGAVSSSLPVSPGNSPSATGFTYASAMGNLCHFLYGGTVTSPSFSADAYERGQSGQTTTFPLTPDPTNYAESYVVDLKVTPGYWQVDPTYPALPAAYTDSMQATINATSETWSASFGSDVPPSATRQIAVAILASYFSTGANQGASSVTIGGVTATKQVETYSNSGAAVAAIWTAVVPTGSSGSVVATFPRTVQYISMAAFAMANVSTTPHNTATKTTSGGTMSITTVAGGYAIAAAMNNASLGGDNFGSTSMPTGRVVGGTLNFDYAAQVTDGTTETSTQNFSGWGVMVGASWG